MRGLVQRDEARLAFRGRTASVRKVDHRQPSDRCGGPGGEKIGYTQSDLATALGIDLTRLQAAYQSANSEALKQAIAKGLIPRTA